jgi:hypothetical protein
MYSLKMKGMFLLHWLEDVGPFLRSSFMPGRNLVSQKTTYYRNRGKVKAKFTLQQVTKAQRSLEGGGGADV